jgi:TRAP-type mannitol/chloroaromatic compound transport system permease large subunit
MRTGKIVFWIIAYLVIEFLNYFIKFINWDLIILLILVKHVADYINKQKQI